MLMAFEEPMEAGSNKAKNFLMFDYGKDDEILAVVLIAPHKVYNVRFDPAAHVAWMTPNRSVSTPLLLGDGGRRRPGRVRKPSSAVEFGLPATTPSQDDDDVREVGLNA